MSLNKMMDEFNTQYGIELVPLNSANAAKAAKFALAEGQEALDETTLTPFNKHDGMKELLDGIYASAQQLRGMGVDVDLGMTKLHESNMSKLVHKNDLAFEIEVARARYFDAEAIHVQGDYFRLYSHRENKVIKPTCYTPADITEALPV